VCLARLKSALQAQCCHSEGRGEEEMEEEEGQENLNKIKTTQKKLRRGAKV